MTLFFLLFLRLIPLYLLILLGYIAGKKLGVSRETIAPLLIYILAPLVIFNAVATTPIIPSLLLLPLFFFFLCSSIGLGTYLIASRYWKDGTASLLGFTAGTGNTGYFGIPVAIALFDQSILGLVVLSLLGFVLYESTVGLYITARGHYTTRQSVKKMLTMPLLYAFLGGLLFHTLPLSFSKEVTELFGNIKGAYSILGMMLLGIGLAEFSRASVDVPFMFLSYGIKFLLWPLLITGAILMDIHFLHLFTAQTHHILLLMGCVPLAANTVAYASTFRLHPEKAALTVFVSTFIALFFIPLVFSFL